MPILMPRFTASAAGIAAPVAMSALREKMPSMSFSDSSLAWISAPLLEMSARPADEVGEDGAAGVHGDDGDAGRGGLAEGALDGVGVARGDGDALAPGADAGLDELGLLSRVVVGRLVVEGDTKVLGGLHRALLRDRPEAAAVAAVGVHAQLDRLVAACPSSSSRRRSRPKAAPPAPRRFCGCRTPPRCMPPTTRTLSARSGGSGPPACGCQEDISVVGVDDSALAPGRWCR